MSEWWIVTAEISPDGETVLFHLPRGEFDPEWDLWTVPISGGTPSLLREDAGFASYGPDGSIVFLDHPQDLAGDVWLMDADGSDARMLAAGGTLAWPEIRPTERASPTTMDSAPSSSPRSRPGGPPRSRTGPSRRGTTTTR